MILNVKVIFTLKSKSVLGTFICVRLKTLLFKIVSINITSKTVFINKVSIKKRLYFFQTKVSQKSVFSYNEFFGNKKCLKKCVFSKFSSTMSIKKRF